MQNVFFPSLGVDLADLVHRPGSRLPPLDGRAAPAVEVAAERRRRSSRCPASLTLLFGSSGNGFLRAFGNAALRRDRAPADQHRCRDPEVPALRDRPAGQPHALLRDPHRAARRRLRRDRRAGTDALPFSSPVGVAASTLAAAALFNPLRGASSGSSTAASTAPATTPRRSSPRSRCGCATRSTRHGARRAAARGRPRGRARRTPRSGSGRPTHRNVPGTVPLLGSRHDQLTASRLPFLGDADVRRRHRPGGPRRLRRVLRRQEGGRDPTTPP